MQLLRKTTCAIKREVVAYGNFEKKYKEVECGMSISLLLLQVTAELKHSSIFELIVFIPVKPRSELSGLYQAKATINIRD